MSKKTFISEVFKSGGTIGALSPSSSFLADKMLQPIHFETAKCIVEFGPGTGVFTHKILDRMHPEAKLIAFEINPVFYTKLLEIKDKRLILINDSAELLDIYLIKNQVVNADYILSSLPFAMIPDKIVEEILKKSHQNLALKGKYIQFQYSLNALSKLKSVFNKVDMKFTLLNLPPAFIFVCKK